MHLGFPAFWAAVAALAACSHPKVSRDADTAGSDSATAEETGDSSDTGETGATASAEVRIVNGSDVRLAYAWICGESPDCLVYEPMGHGAGEPGTIIELSVPAEHTTMAAIDDEWNCALWGPEALQPGESYEWIVDSFPGSWGRPYQFDCDVE